ncbi:helix-turn-helix domain-containing protein [Tannerella forsythia]
MQRYIFRADTPFEFELKDLAEITHKKSQLSGVPHRTDFYQIIRITSGESVQTVDFNKITIGQGKILFVAKNQVVQFDTHSDYNGQIVLFTDDFFNRYDTEEAFLKRLQLFNLFSVNRPVNTTPNIDALWGMLTQEVRAKGEFQHRLIHSYLSALLIESERLFAFPSGQLFSANMEQVMRFTDSVETHYKQWRKVNDYTDHLGISAKRLSKNLQAIVGKTPKEYLDDRILLEAKRLLAHSSLNIKEITFNLGFEEPTNFSKFFREKSGKTPLEFKQSALAERS